MGDAFAFLDRQFRLFDGMELFVLRVRRLISMGTGQHENDVRLVVGTAHSASAVALPTTGPQTYYSSPARR
jgi:hypothetical protein